MMPLDMENGAKALQLITSRYDVREWRKKIEKTLSLTPTGLENEVQRKIFMYLKVELQAYKSRRADPPSWIVGGYATREVIDRVKHRPMEIDPSMTFEQVSFLGTDPGVEVDLAWWEDMIVKWFEEPEEEVVVDDKISGEDSEESTETKNPETEKSKNV